jgi:hypothetical protein
MIACPYVLYVRDPYRPSPGWARTGAEYHGVVAARQALRVMRRFWPHCAWFIQYPPVGD